MPKSVTIKSSLIALACSIALSTHAFADAAKRIEVPAGELVAALEALAKQADVELVYQAAQLKGILTEGLSGSYAPKEAVSLLLKGTKLILRTDESSGVMLIALPSPLGSSNSPQAAAEDVAGKSWRLAQADSREQNDEPSAGDESSQQQVHEYEVVKGIPEILVWGTRSLNTDIERTEDDAQPYVVFDRAQIQRSMATNVEEFLKTRLPMNTAQVSNSQNVIQNFIGASNASNINLRGLGTDQTLILVDGRRMPGYGFGGSFGQPDINGIPLSAIERIEVLPSTASAIYGGGATGGVINIITRRDYSGLELGVAYGDVFDGDASSSRIDLGYSLSLEDGRTQVLVTSSYAQSDPLQVGERDFLERALALQWANNPNAFLTPTVPPLGATTNIRSQNGSNLILDNGTALGSPRTFVPVNYAGPASDAGAALLANAGRYNLEPPDDVNGNNRSLIGNPTVSSVSLNVRRRFGEHIEAFVDASLLDNAGRATLADVVSTVTIPANAPNNPFTTAINTRFPVPGLSFVQRNDSETLRAMGGVIVRLPANWTAAIDYSWSRSRHLGARTTLLGDPDGAGPAQSVNTALTNGTLDVLRDVNAFPLDYSPYLLPSPSEQVSFEALLKNLTLRFSGPLVRLPAGPLVVSAMLERRDEQLPDAFWRFTDGRRRYFPDRSQSVDAYYLEASAPLVSEGFALPLVHELDLQVSVRHDEYETKTPYSAAVAGGSFVDLPSADSPRPAFDYLTNSASETKHMFGLRYTPLKGLVLRASFGNGFLPPALTQLTPVAPAPLTVTVIDPKRGSVSTTYQVTHGRQFSPDLAPEQSESWSAGFVFTPRLLSDLRLSVDYTKIKKTREIAFYAAQPVVDLEDFLPAGRVTRAALTDADRALGYTGGVITGLDTSFVNLASSRLEAYDVQADYVLRTERAGDFSLYAVATWQRSLERQVSPLAPIVDSVGFNNGQLEWRGNGGLSWSRNRWTLGWDVQYFDSYRVHSATASAAAAATAILNQGSAFIPSQTYHDVFARYTVGANAAAPFGLLSNMEIKLGIQNLLDESPPILATISASNSGYSTYGDALMRRYMLSVRKTF